MKPIHTLLYVSAGFKIILDMVDTLYLVRLLVVLLHFIRYLQACY